MSFDPRVFALVAAAAVGAWGGIIYEKANTQNVRLEFSAYKLAEQKAIAEQKQANLDDYVTQVVTIKEAEDASAKRMAAQERKFLAVRDKWVADSVRAQAAIDSSLSPAPADSGDSAHSGDADELACRVSRPAVVEKAQEYDKLVEALAVCKAYVEALPSGR
jgi:hypothetical protein